MLAIARLITFLLRIRLRCQLLPLNRNLFELYFPTRIVQEGLLLKAPNFRWNCVAYMNIRTSRTIKLVIALAGITVIAGIFFRNSRKVDYNAEVKPLLNKKCISCHGGVKQSGGFGLLTREQALQKTESGHPAIIPGNASASEFIKRLSHPDPESRMPMNADPLSKEEIALLEKWIDQGAHWDDHWSYLPVKKPEVPEPGFFSFFSPKKEWARNEIDFFTFDKMKEHGLEPSPEADQRTLLRRVSLDLTGLPLPEKAQAAFLADNSANAYEKLVDILLNSPRFGERWAAVWMDLARYADSKGYERDGARPIWRYRDWLINSFNNDMPYNQFLVEQLAGDLLPDPTDAQYIATAFHRNTQTNDEGGTDNEEFRNAALMDRVNTTWEAVLGTTFSCVQCHSHPYDPFFHEDYYTFLAFFNQSGDEDSYEDYPVLRSFHGADSSRADSLITWMKQAYPKAQYDYWNKLLRTYQPAYNSVTCDDFNGAALLDTKWLGMSNNSTARLRKVNLDGARQLIVRYATGFKQAQWQIRLDSVNGPLLTSIQVPATKRWEIHRFDIPPVQGTHDLYFVYATPELKGNTQSFGVNFSWFSFAPAFPADFPEEQYLSLLNAPSEVVPVMVDFPQNMQRKSFLFERGNWLVKGKEVQANVPVYLGALEGNTPKTRLDMARWLTSKQNPLTARVIVNRLWEQLFGRGIVETVEDFGSQGFAPTHPELLDFLAWEFMHHHQWSLKKTLKKMVMSATYRQRSELRTADLEKDPDNRFLARGARVRLSAEQIRDQSLAVSGLLSYKMYGQSVMPYQPDGIWLAPWDGAKWTKSEGEDQYRRAIYTFWKRGSPYPSMIAFDGAARNVCSARRIRTNTPLQALVSLNDPVYVEAAEKLAERMSQSGRQLKERIAAGYRMAMGKEISIEKRVVFETLYHKAINAVKGEGDAKEKEALKLVANALLNMDEFITKS